MRGKYDARREPIFGPVYCVAVYDTEVHSLPKESYMINGLPADGIQLVEVTTGLIFATGGVDPVLSEENYLDGLPTPSFQRFDHLENITNLRFMKPDENDASASFKVWPYRYK